MARRKKTPEAQVTPGKRKFCQGMSAYYDDTPEIFPPDILDGKYSKYFLEKKGLMKK